LVKGGVLKTKWNWNRET